MGAKQSLEESDDIASPRSPTSPRVVPVDGGETSNTAQLQLDTSRGDEALSPKSSGTVTLHNDDDDAASPLDDEPGRAASQRSLSRRLSGLLSGGKNTDASNESRAPARTLVLKGHANTVICLTALGGDRLASGRQRAPKGKCTDQDCEHKL